MKVSAYSKAIAALIGQAITYAQLYYGSNKYVAMAVALAMALGVFSIPNTPKSPPPPPPPPPVPPASLPALPKGSTP